MGVIDTLTVLAVFEGYFLKLRVMMILLLLLLLLLAKMAM